MLSARLSPSQPERNPPYRLPLFCPLPLGVLFFKARMSFDYSAGAPSTADANDVPLSHYNSV